MSHPDSSQEYLKTYRIWFQHGLSITLDADSPENALTMFRFNSKIEPYKIELEAQ